MGRPAVRLRIDRLTLIGADRSLSFDPGLNLITGPITTGKTSLLRLQRVLLGSGVGTFPREIRDHVSAVGGQITIGSDSFAIVRPLVSTVSAKVDIAGRTEALRLPALQRGPEGAPSYKHTNSKEHNCCYDCIGICFCKKFHFEFKEDLFLKTNLGCL